MSEPDYFEQYNHLNHGFANTAALDQTSKWLMGNYTHCYAR